MDDISVWNGLFIFLQIESHCAKRFVKFNKIKLETKIYKSLKSIQYSIAYYRQVCCNSVFPNMNAIVALDSNGFVGLVHRRKSI